jgi:hypothetical protein
MIDFLFTFFDLNYLFIFKIKIALLESLGVFTYYPEVLERYSPIENPLD